MRKLLALLIVASCAGTDASQSSKLSSDDASTSSGACTRTQGYWKNHPDAWPVQTLTLGQTSYSEDQCLDILHSPVKGNGLVSLAHQLIAAKLNVAAGATSVQAIADADALIGALVLPGGYLSPDQTSALTGALDAFNSSNDTDDCGSTPPPPPPPPPSCGNGVVETGEQCDDGNTTSGDGCSATCQLEGCDTCHAPVCGNGIVETGELCDDGNTTAGDGCSPTCQLEVGKPYVWSIHKRAM
jgi:cysteine-rich repeat protein